MRTPFSRAALVVVCFHLFSFSKFHGAELPKAGFGLNCGVAVDQPSVESFSVSPSIHLKPLTPAQFYISPNQSSTLRWTYSTRASGTVADVIIKDYTGQEYSKVKAAIPTPGMLDVSVNLPEGYYTFFFPEAQQEFGLVVIPAYSGQKDPFFGIDAALSELVPFDQREALVAILHRGGITTARERMSWGQLEPAPGQWNWSGSFGRYEETRQLYQKAGVRVLELFAGAPGWLEQDIFPRDLVSTEKAWEAIGDRFQPYWQGVEVWNEPDTAGSGGNMPADQYLPMVKAIHYAFYNAKLTTPLGGGVFAYTNKPYLDLAARNGLLDELDFLSFHYYGEADNLQSYVGEYRAYLARNGDEGMPLWITEMGPPWEGKAGLRIPADADAARGSKFARNAVEARALGIASIFPFVMVNYSEQGSRVFGMLDPSGSPLRAMGTYLEVIHMLAGTSYIGDLKESPGSRVFKRDQNTAIVAYIAKDGAPPPFPFKEMRGIDGRLLKSPPDGLSYLTVNMTDLAPMLNANTLAMKLDQMAAKTNPKRVIPSPLILMPLVENGSVVPSVRGYQISEGTTELPLYMRVANLGRDVSAIKLTFSVVSPTNGPDVVLAVRNLTVPPGGVANTDVQILVSSLQLDESGMAVVKISGPAGVSPCAVCFIISRGLKEQLSAYSYQFALPIEEVARWKENSSGNGTIYKTNDGGWAYDVSFGEGPKWAYPRFTLPQEVNLNRVTSVLIRARCMKPAEVRLMIFTSQTNQSNTPYSIIRADGQWHLALIPLDGLISSAAGEPLGRQIRDLSVGLNNVGSTNRLEVSDIYLLGN